MSDAIDLRVRRSLELLGELKAVTAEFVRREEELTRDFRNRRYAVSRGLRDGIEHADARLAERTGALETGLQEREAEIRRRYEQRSAAIQSAHHGVLRTVRAKAQQAAEKWRADLQMRHFNAERALPRDLRAADAAYSEFTGLLTAEGARRADLDARAWSTFSGFWNYQSLLRNAAPPAAEAQDPPPDRDRLFAEVQALLTGAETHLAAYRRFFLARFFTYVPIFAVIPLALLGGLALAYALGFDAPAFTVAGAAAATVIGAIAAAYIVGLQQAKPSATGVATSLAGAVKALHDCGTAAARQHADERAGIQGEYDRTMSEVAGSWDHAGEIGRDYETKARRKSERQVPRAFAKNESLLQPRLKRVQAEAAVTIERLKTETAAAKTQLEETNATEAAAVEEAETTAWADLVTDWKRRAHPLFAEVADMNAALSEEFPSWTAKSVEEWTPPTAFLPATKFGQLQLDFSEPGAALPKDPRLSVPYGPLVSIPLALTYPDQGSLLFETKESAAGTIVSVLNNIILRLLTTTPPGKLTLTIIDPVGLGESFAGLMHLADYEESLINRRIWTQRDHLEERLAEMSEHTEKVIQMYLRNDFATITEYNEQAGSVAEKYHFLIVTDFPSGFGETSAKRLQSIAASGPRCGLYTLIHWDKRQTLPDGIDADELRRHSVVFYKNGDHFTLGPAQEETGAKLKFDPPPATELATPLIHKIGQNSVDSNRVEVPFSQIAPAREDMWKADTTDELRVAIGRTGATKHQMLEIGKGTRQHALFAGKTGSGKSTLFHVIITNLALTCSPEQVEFYLIDFKKGVEFKCYGEKRLPHAKVVAIESDREFALSVLERVDEELKRRGDIFRELGVQDIPGYKRAGGEKPMPRCLLIIDEFQEFFVEDDTVAQNTSVLLDRIVRQGRAFGIHVLLGSQTLGGAYSLARATLGQMVIRVALQCNEADAYLIMDDSNAAPRLLSRPGEGIYNDAAGAIEGNSPFQVVWLGDDERDTWLDKVREVADERGDQHPGPIVFEGNAPADIHENHELEKTLATVPDKRPSAPRIWLGAPNSIKGPTHIAFQRQSGNHLLFVGQREDTTLTLLGLAIIALAAQHPPGAAKFMLLHGVNPDTSDAHFVEEIPRLVPHHDVRIASAFDIPEIMDALAAEMKDRLANGAAATEAPTTFLLIHGLQKFKKLRHEDDFSFSSSDTETSNPGAQFNDLITEGSTVGLHILVSVDTFNNVNRAMNRKALSEFEMRVIFQMSANDSASLIETPKASGLGLHRALLYNEQQGSLETFRPYSRPDAAWLREAGEKLAGKTGNVGTNA